MTEAAQKLMRDHIAPDADESTSSDIELSPLEVREKLGLTVPEMADLIGMSEFGYEMWEDGNRRPGGPAYKLLALLVAHPKDTLARLRE